MRKFNIRAQAIGVIFESEEDFGEVIPTPSLSKEKGDAIKQLMNSGKLQHLDNEGRIRIGKVLNQYKTLFEGQLRVANTEEHKIILRPEVERKKPYMYRIPESLKDKVNEQVEELEALGLIEPSQAEIAYPVVCVNKKDGELRLCIDFRALNEATVGDAFPMQNASDLINQVSRANMITVIDCLKGYWSIPLAKECRDLTSFATDRAQYRWRVMPFGLKGAAATFQRAMNKVLAPYQKFTRAFIDDIIVFSRDMQEHIQHLSKVLKKLQEVGLAVKLEKCEFAKPSVRYLGHIVGSGRHSPDPEKLETVQGILPPTTKKELRSFLGLYNYYKDYVPNYAEIAYPLTELTKRRVPINIPWGDKEAKAFNQLKEALCHAPSVHSPQLGKEFIIQTDASEIAIGACLSQRDENGKLYPVSFASAKLSDSQRKWSAVEREAFAIVWGLKKFETWIFGSKIEVITDHNPLTFLTKSAPQSSKLQRWTFALQKYDLRVNHSPGAKLQNADGLSRLATTAWKD